FSRSWRRLSRGDSVLEDPDGGIMAVDVGPDNDNDSSTPSTSMLKDMSQTTFSLATLASPPSPPSTQRLQADGLSNLETVFGPSRGGGVVAGEGRRWGMPTGVGMVAGLGPGLGSGLGSGPGPGPGLGLGLGLGQGLVRVEAEQMVLPLSIIPSNQKPLAIDRRIEDILRLLCPVPRAEGYRRSVFKFVARQVKRALGAQCFPIGGYALQTYLPDEEVNMSAFLCHGQEKSWFIRVNETLCKVWLGSESEALHRRNNGGAGGLSEDERASIDSDKDTGSGGGGGGGGGGKGVGYTHRLSNVNFINTGHVQRIKCVVDNQVAVDIKANRLGDLCTVALLEEVDQLLGKDHLLKRSLLLVKSWWLYESRAFTGSNMLSHITMPALSTMVLGVVNQHHARLHTPLQVLAMFFHMHSQFDWSRYCWCVEGPRHLSSITSPPRGTTDGNPPVQEGGVSGPTPTLLSQEILRKYQPRQNKGVPQREAGEGEGAVEGGGGGFPIRNMNVMNPLDPTDNLIDETVNRRRARRMQSLLQVSCGVFGG
ncbi:unnamed protein product, partial [Discosporangium mesarthrocarpum]